MANGAISAAVGADISVALFQFFEYLPLTVLTSTLGIILVAVFFVTSSDSGSMVVDTIASGGTEKRRSGNGSTGAGWRGWSRPCFCWQAD